MPGHVNWIELPAKDTAAARIFYTGLFGWSTTEFGEDYHVIDNGPAGAITPRTDTFDHPASTSPQTTSTPPPPASATSAAPPATSKPSPA